VIVMGAVALLLVAAFVALERAYPPARLAALLAEAVQAATGREVRIGGALSFRLLPTIAVVAEDVSLGNAPWGTRKEMATVKRAAFEVAISPLLHGQLHVLSVALDGVDVLLETDEHGHPNWIFSDGTESNHPGSTPSAPASPPQVDLDRLVLSDARIAYRIGLTRATHTVAIESLQILNQSEQTQVSARFAGPHRPWRLDAKTGRYVALMNDKADWPFDVTLAADGAKLTATGALDARGDLRAKVAAHVTNGAVLTGWPFETAALPLPIDASATLQRGTAGVTADSVLLTIAGQTLSGKVTVRTQRAPMQMELEMAAAAIDLSRWAFKQPAPATAPGATARKPLFADTPLPAIALPAFPLRATVRVDQLLAPGMPALSDVKARLEVEPDRLVVDALSFAVAGGQVQGRLELGARSGEPLRVKLRGTANALSLEALDTLRGGGHFRGGRVNVRADVAATGRTPHDLAASADGSVLLSVADATMAGSAAVKQRNVIVAVLEALLPKQQADSSKIECGVVNLPLRSGVARIDRSIAVETNTMAVAASGEVNLVAQTMSLSFRPIVKKGLGLDSTNLANLVMVEGPLQDPEIHLDMKGTALEAVSIGAAVASAGLTVVGKRLLTQPEDTQVCRRAMGTAAR
jgi:uncharacterized protein involved in outer membrane biogenesis